MLEITDGKLERMADDLKTLLYPGSKTCWSLIDNVSALIPSNLPKELLHHIARNAGVSYTHLHYCVRLAHYFPPMFRAAYSPLTVKHARYALATETLYANQGSPENDPRWWAKQAVDWRWSAQTLQAVIHQAVPALPSLNSTDDTTQRIDRLVRLAHSWLSRFTMDLRALSYDPRSFPSLGYTLALVPVGHPVQLPVGALLSKDRVLLWKCWRWNVCYASVIGYTLTLQAATKGEGLLAS